MTATDVRNLSIALIGLSGTGKSTVARILAGNLGWFWLDTDDEIVERASRSIADIFGEQGEAIFREIETRVLTDALQTTTGQPQVIATGGGIVLAEENRTLLRNQSYVAWLDAPTDTLLARLSSHDTPRPLLSVEAPAERLEELRTARMTFYRNLANQIVSTEGLTPWQVADQVMLEYLKFVSGKLPPWTQAWRRPE